MYGGAHDSQSTCVQAPLSSDKTLVTWPIESAVELLLIDYRKVKGMSTNKKAPSQWISR